jgi:hypothetical protein
MDNATANAMHQDRHDGEVYRRIELITGSVRRRRWSAEEKAAIGLRGLALVLVPQAPAILSDELSDGRIIFVETYRSQVSVWEEGRGVSRFAMI